MKGAPEAQGMTKALSWMFIDHNARRVPKPRIAEENRWREKEWNERMGSCLKSITPITNSTYWFAEALAPFINGFAKPPLLLLHDRCQLWESRRSNRH
jgi:hypothetical protein